MKQQIEDILKKITGQPTSTEVIKKSLEDNYNERKGNYENVINYQFSTKHLTNVVGGQLHDQWRANRKQENGTFEPRIKKTKDENWIKVHGKDEVDIANTSYEDLPEDWKGENKISAEVTVGEISKALEEKKDLDDKFIEEASSVLHDKWLERNGSWAQEDQKKPYNELSPEEKEKDRVIIKEGIARHTEMEKHKNLLKIMEEIQDTIYSDDKYWVMEKRFASIPASVELNLDEVRKLIDEKSKSLDKNSGVTEKDLLNSSNVNLYTPMGYTESGRYRGFDFHDTYPHGISNGKRPLPLDLSLIHNKRYSKVHYNMVDESYAKDMGWRK